MAWKDTDSNGLPKFDFEHPRVIAAMRVTGIQASDLTSRPPPIRLSPKAGALTARAIMDRPRGGEADKGGTMSPAGASTARSDTLARSKDLWERKQRQLLRELEATADALDDSDVDAILSPGALDATEAEAEYNKRKAQVDRMRQRLVAQLQRDAQREIDRSSVQDVAAREREAVEKRLKEQMDERRALLRAEAEKRAEKHTKVQERVKQCNIEARQRREAIRSKLASGETRVTKMIEDRLSGESGKYQEVRSRMARIAERKMAHEQMEMERNVRRYEDAKQHDREVEERLIQARVEEKERLEERRNKFSGRMDKVLDTQLQQEREREKAFLEGVKKLDTARVAQVTKAHEITEAVKAARDKQLNKWTVNRQTLRQKRKEYVTQLKSDFAESHQKADEGRERYYEELVFTKSANRGLLQDVVDQNKARITRSDDCARKQTLAKVERDMARTATALSQRQQLQAHRTAVIRESMLGRTKVEELKRINPAAGEASAKRVNDILRELDMPPLPSGPAKEGEEGQQQ